MNNLDSDHRKQTKSLFSLWKENTSLSNTILFLAFQTFQNKHKGLALQTFICFLPTKEPCRPNNVSLIDEESTQNIGEASEAIFSIVYASSVFQGY